MRGSMDELTLFPGLFHINDRTDDRVVDGIPDFGDEHECSHMERIDLEHQGVEYGQEHCPELLRTAASEIAERDAELVPHPERSYSVFLVHKSSSNNRKRLSVAFISYQRLIYQSNVFFKRIKFLDYITDTSQ